MHEIALFVEDHADLRDKLEKRILALIGEGPEISSENQAR